MKNKILAMILYFTVPVPAFSLDVGDISSFMYSNSKIIQKEIKNTTDTGRFINIKVEKISSPLEGAKNIPMDKPDELLLTPGSLLLPARNSESVRFIYNGPEDSQERYYRIVWVDNALGDVGNPISSRNAIATTSARIGTILVVAPRKTKYSYQYDKSEKKITNNGNATLRIVAYGSCLKASSGSHCKENYFLMPGHSRTFKSVNIDAKNSHLAMWQAEDFVSIK